jgi:hypothetical protein
LKQRGDLSGFLANEGLSMPKKVLRLIILFTAFFIIGVNRGDLTSLLNVGSTIHVSCIEVG